MMALGLVYPLGAVLQGWMANTHGVRAVTVAGAVALLALAALAAVVRPTIFTNLGDPVVLDDGPVPVAAGRRSRARRRHGMTDSAPVTPGAPVEVLTAADAEEAQRRAAGALLGAGLGAGDRVAFCLPSSAGLLCAVLGALRVGIVPVLLNATLLDAERDLLVEDAAPGSGRDRRRRPGPPRPRAGDGARPSPAGPADALHVGHHRAGQGRVVGAVGRGRGRRRPGRRGRPVGVRPRRRAPGLLADVPLGVGAVRRRDAAGAAGRA